MDKVEANVILQAELKKYRGRGYLSLRQLLDDGDAYEVRGPSGTQYQIEVQVFWDDRPDGNLRVIASIDDGGLLSAFAPITDSFILAPGENSWTNNRDQKHTVDEGLVIFEGICIMTGDVPRLAHFYQELFGAASEGNDDHTTMNIGGLGVAIWKQAIPEGMSDAKMRAIRKHCFALMFSSPDVHKTYERARGLGAVIQEIPADQPWGGRAFVMNDPDGNRIDVFEKR